MTVQTIDANHAGRRRLDEPATIRFTPSGRPIALRWHGSIWQAFGESVPSPGAGSGAWTDAGRGPGTTASAWLFTAQTGPVSPVLEFRIAFDTRREEWRLLSVRPVEG
ncbi:hypothetical protein FDK12_06360 [Arthrobacter sp. NamB2]|uniref:hypothetical protein n=1 Tax=Arthrobacter sp. NamB2 TaxID=2576035 RepID=UPI0010C9EFA3|nr:hypothetical protein [Arthrobacter sp. NamB2]TKV29255.1 hypothetical protein FDK12_06360 [Arthrobacter sp. NamB2]